jgi:hypothetical protein
VAELGCGEDVAPPLQVGGGRDVADDKGQCDDQVWRGVMTELGQFRRSYKVTVAVGGVSGGPR